MATRIESRKRNATKTASKKAARTEPAPASTNASADAAARPVKTARSRKATPPPNLFARALDLEHDVALEIFRRMTQMRHLTAEQWRGYEAALAGVGSVMAPDDVVHIALSTGNIGYDLAWVSAARGIAVEALHVNPMRAPDGSDADRGTHPEMSHHSLLGQRCLTGDIALAPGAALACLLQRKRQILISLLDKKVSSSGAFFETLQLALAWEVPLLFVAFHEPPESKAATQGRTWVSRAESFGLKAVRCDGLCALEVRDKAREAMEWVRLHKMPFLLELAIPDSARRPEAINDPVQLFRTRLLEAGVLKPSPQ